jgi:hypothetical protein
VQALLLTMLGALIPTFLLSRLYRWLLSKRGRHPLALPHIFSYGSAVLFYALGAADGGPPRFLEGAVVYALPQFVWYLYDGARKRSAAPIT